MAKDSPQYDGAQYDKYRPGYPVAVAEKAVSFLDVSSQGGTFLEIGFGTGKGTAPFIEGGAQDPCCRAFARDVGHSTFKVSEFQIHGYVRQI